MDLPYRPRDPRSYRPPIALIGCGGIATNHLKAYRAADYNVAALCDVDIEKAKDRRQEFFPNADCFENWEEVIRRDDIEVVDIATHPPIRPPIIEAALRAGKHVLSQKPFVTDLEVGERLVELAAECNVQLAVNQNGRWAPHFSYMRAAVQAGVLGTVSAVHCSVHWDHSWVAGTEFEKIRHLILYDYGIHWFDIVHCLLAPRRPKRVYATVARSASQTVDPPLLAQAIIEYDDAQVSLAFDANTKFGAQDRTYVAGTDGSISSVGPGNKQQQLTLTTAGGTFQPQLEGCWFPDGFHGTMGELLCSIEENRTPVHNAADNLGSLSLCFAAVASADLGKPVVPGSVTSLTT